jgi:hypothetical protein
MCVGVCMRVVCITLALPLEYINSLCKASALRTQTHRDNKGTRADLWAVLRSVRLALFNEQLSLPRSYGLPQFAQRSVRL